MKNFQKIAFGVLVAFLAIGFSAFTPTKNKALSTFIVQTSDGTFQQYTSTDPIDLDNCDPSTDHRCVYEVTAAGQTGITTSGPWTDSDINGFLSHVPAYLTAESPSNGVYNP